MTTSSASRTVVRPAGPASEGEAVAAEPGDRAPGDRVERLTDSLTALREEVEGLRTAARFRSMIEQAKGILMERDGIGPDEAFVRLRALSQQHNARLVEVAATVVGVAIPSDDLSVGEVDALIRERLPTSSAPSPAWQGLQAQPDVRAGVAGALLHVVAAGTERGQGAAQLLAELLQPYEVDGVILYRRLADDSLQLCGQSGVPADLVSSWSHIPPVHEIPYVVAAVEGRSLFWGQRSQWDHRFPATAEVVAHFEAVAVVPIRVGDRAIGVAGLLWCDGREFAGTEESALSSLVQRLGPALLRDAAPTDPEVEWLGAVLSLQLDPWALLEVVSTSDGADDVVVLDVAQDVPPGKEVIGRHLRELWPTLAADGTFDALLSLTSSGGVWTMTVTHASDSPWGSPGTRLRAVRLGHRVVVAWRPPTARPDTDDAQGVSASADSACC